jgi:2-polyprenyl-6-methoxyphenol hydroxylase-like FAD-dependent oxidoreductase
MMGQDHTERILRSHLEKYGCQVELGTKLRSFEQYPDHVTVDLVITRNGQDITEMMDYDWVVGADGACSMLY